MGSESREDLAVGDGDPVAGIGPGGTGWAGVQLTQIVLSELRLSTLAEE